MTDEEFVKLELKRTFDRFLKTKPKSDEKSLALLGQMLKAKLLKLEELEFLSSDIKPNFKIVRDSNPTLFQMVPLDETTKQLFKDVFEFKEG